MLKQKYCDRNQLLFSYLVKKESLFLNPGSYIDKIKHIL